MMNDRIHGGTLTHQDKHDRRSDVHVAITGSSRRIRPMARTTGITTHWKHTTQSEFDISNVTKLPRVDIILPDEDM